MFEGIDLNQIMKQAQDFQKELQKKKEEGKNKFHSVAVGGGMVELEISESMEVKSLKIDNELLSPKEKSTLEELVVLAVNQAIQKVQKEFTPDLSDMISGVQKTFMEKK